MSPVIKDTAEAVSASDRLEALLKGLVSRLEALEKAVFGVNHQPPPS